MISSVTNILYLILEETQQQTPHSLLKPNGHSLPKLQDTTGVLQVELSFFEHFDQGARVTRVTMPTARYLALGKFFQNY
jgi:hypothetical protein